jgi:hypothetical protein
MGIDALEGRWCSRLHMHTHILTHTTPHPFSHLNPRSHTSPGLTEYYDNILGVANAAGRPAVYSLSNCRINQLNPPRYIMTVVARLVNPNSADLVLSDIVTLAGVSRLTFVSRRCLWGPGIV